MSSNFAIILAICMALFVTGFTYIILVESGFVTTSADIWCSENGYESAMSRIAGSFCCREDIVNNEYFKDCRELTTFEGNYYFVKEVSDG